MLSRIEKGFAKSFRKKKPAEAGRFSMMLLF